MALEAAYDMSALMMAMCNCHCDGIRLNDDAFQGSEIAVHYDGSPGQDLSKYIFDYAPSILRAISSDHA